MVRNTEDLFATNYSFNSLLWLSSCNNGLEPPPFLSRLASELHFCLLPFLTSLNSCFVYPLPHQLRVSTHAEHVTSKPDNRHTYVYHFCGTTA